MTGAHGPSLSFSVVILVGINAVNLDTLTPALCASSPSISDGREGRGGEGGGWCRAPFLPSSGKLSPLGGIRKPNGTLHNAAASGRAQIGGLCRWRHACEVGGLSCITRHILSVRLSVCLCRSDKGTLTAIAEGARAASLASSNERPTTVSMFKLCVYGVHLC